MLCVHVVTTLGLDYSKRWASLVPHAALLMPLVAPQALVAVMTLYD